MIEKPYRTELVREVQGASRNWWAKNPMSYDWRGTNPAPEGTREFFEEIDRRFFHASPLYRGERPFADLIPFAQLRGKRVLEIGCGLGSHSQLLAEAGCKLTSIDLTPRAVMLTTRRLALHHLLADVREMDAERMDFGDSEFDFVWSWGVIHHSAHTDQIVRQVARVLKPGGEFRLMVYNRRAFDTYTKVVRGLMTGKPFRGMSMDDILSFYTDGYLARFYTRRQLAELIEDNGLQNERISVLGQTSELVPLPGKGRIGQLKYRLVAKIPAGMAETTLKRTGSFLFAVARKPSGAA
jgi:2-polyprenyl-3-methyl-5-hydroxy-6-metoxy-1,4-benzoquinol methylase